MSRAAGRLSDHAHLRSDRVVAALRRAMGIIEAEIEANEGLYPYNSGRLSQAELCRRAGVANVTLQNPSHKTTTLVEVNKWLARVRAKIVAGQKSVRKTVTDRVDQWKHEYKKVATHYNVSRLEVADLKGRLKDANAALAEAKAHTKALEAEISVLRSELAQGKVVQLPRRG